MKKIMFFILLLFLAELVSSQLILTEIMANPDSGDEWLEFYAQEDFSLDGTQISDNYQTDDVVCCNQSTCNMSVRKGEYFLITNMENTVYADFFYGHLTGKNQTAEAENTINFTTPKMFCVDDKSIGNGLGNTEDIITLAQGEETFLEFYYEVSFPKGISYSYFNKTWNFSMPSPWKENVLFAVVHEEIGTGEHDFCILREMEDVAYVGIEYKLFRIKDRSYLSGKTSNITLSYNISYAGNTTNTSSELVFSSFSEPRLISYTTTETGRFIFDKEGEYIVCGKINYTYEDASAEDDNLCFSVVLSDPKKTQCNITLDMVTDKQVYDEGEQIQIFHNLSNETFPYSITYWAEDLFGNIEKTKAATKNTNKKTFTPKDIGREKAFWICSELSSIACNNTERHEPLKKLVIVRGNISDRSSIVIEKIYTPEEGISFGDTIKVRLAITKGDSPKNSISLYIAEGSKKPSYVTQLNLYGKGKEVDVTVPVKIKENCNRYYDLGDYTLYAEGLDVSDKKEVEIENKYDGCLGPENSAAMSSKESASQYSLEYYDTNITKTDQISSLLRITNTDNTTHSYSVWSYIYSGSKSYSGEREENIQTIYLGPAEEKLVFLKNSLETIPNKDVLMKWKIQRDDRKTAYEFTEKVHIFINNNTAEEVMHSETGAKELSHSLNIHNLNGTRTGIEEKISSITGNTIYVSPEKKMVSYFPSALLVLILAGVFLIYKIN